VKELAARNSKFAWLGHGTVTFFDDTTSTGYRIKLPGFDYPIVVDPKSGNIAMDNYNGKWGDEKYINELKRAYPMQIAVEAAAEHNATNFDVVTNADGSVDIEIEVADPLSADSGSGPTDPMIGGSSCPKI
jgi:hypothetical protein